MKRLHLNQQGSSLLVVVLGLAIIGLAGVAAYRVSTADDNPEPSSPPAKVVTKAPDSLNSSADVIKADQSLDSLAIDGDVNPNQLDDDISAL